MSAPKHTPEPWETEYDATTGTFTLRMYSAIENRGCYLPAHPIDLYATDTETRSVLVLPHAAGDGGNPVLWGRRPASAAEDAWEDQEPGFFAEAEANARLIAAAPDLLAACEAQLRLAAWTSNEDCGCTLMGRECEACVVNRQTAAAIAKAKGVQS